MTTHERPFGRLYEDFERRDALLKLARFRTTASGGRQTSLLGGAVTVETMACRVG